MSNGSDGRFTRDEIKKIWEAHREWCDKHAVQPNSIHGEEAAAAMLSMFKSGMMRKHELVAWHGPDRRHH